MLGKFGYAGRAGEDKLDAAGSHAPAGGGGGPAAPAAPLTQRFFLSGGSPSGTAVEPLRAGLAAGSAPPPPGGPGSPGPAASDVKNGSDGWFLGQGQSQPGLADGALGEMLAFNGADPRFDRLRLIEELEDDDGAGPFGGIGERRAQRGIERYSADDIVRFCRIRPHETPSAMFFRCWGDNPFELAALDRLSTFAADVDTASYALARNYLSRGIMPTKAQIRTEEFVNSFGSGVPAPAKDVFGIDLEMAPSLFGSGAEWMLRVVVRGKEVDKQERPHLALTFVVDTSGSMKQENRIELVKHALRLLVGELDQNDAIAIVAFSTEARLVLPMTSAGNKAIIESAIFGLNADGSTNAEAGLLMGYAQAAQGLTAGANNRVVMLSDGVANVGNVDVAKLLGNVELQRAQGIYLNTIGVGMGNHNDALLEQLADKGDGICNYIDTQAEAVKVLVDGFTGQFVPIARDVKIQVEFDPAQVQSYRLLGYENRAIADADFRKDEVDAGEVGAGHQVTALYEIVRNPTSTNDGPLATARVRYKPPFAIDSARTDAASREAAEVALEIEKPIAFNQVTTGFQGATVGYQKAVLVAQLAEFLRRSVHARGDSFPQLVVEAIRLEKVAEDPAFTAFTTMVAGRMDLIERNLPPNDAVAQAIDKMTRHNYLQGKIAQLQAENHLLTDEILQRLQSQNADLERQLLELLQQHLQQGR
jgi:Ca-activated chloride channel family protein